MLFIIYRMTVFFRVILFLFFFQSNLAIGEEIKMIWELGKDLDVKYGSNPEDTPPNEQNKLFYEVSQRCAAIIVTFIQIDNTSDQKMLNELESKLIRFDIIHKQTIKNLNLAKNDSAVERIAHENIQNWIYKYGEEYQSGNINLFQTDAQHCEEYLWGLTEGILSNH